MNKYERNKQKNKQGALLGIGLIIGGLLAGCNIQEIQYQGKQRPVSEVEEMLEDYLESENPNWEFNVKITEGMGND